MRIFANLSMCIEELPPEYRPYEPPPKYIPMTEAEARERVAQSPLHKILEAYLSKTDAHL